MCEFCRSYPCDDNCPNSDAEAVVRCKKCRGWYSGSVTYYKVDGINICEDCIHGYIENHIDEETYEAVCDVCDGKITDGKRYLLDGYTICNDCIDNYLSACSRKTRG